MTPTTPERWLPVVGFEGLYEVSDLGRVRSLDRYVQRAGHWMLKRGQTKRAELPSVQGRIRVGMTDRSGKSSTLYVHTLVLTAFVGPRPGDMECCHNDGDPTNNQLNNLRWDTKKANAQDTLRHGNHARRNVTHCPRNHELAEPNLCRGMWARGHRSCLACHRAEAAKVRAARRSEPFDFKAEADAYYQRITQAA